MDSTRRFLTAAPDDGFTEGYASVIVDRDDDGSIWNVSLCIGNGGEHVSLHAWEGKGYKAANSALEACMNLKITIREFEARVMEMRKQADLGLEGDV